jgi:hypothetical protein
MKYKLVNRDGWDFLNAAKFLGRPSSGPDLDCPFASTTAGGEMYCGSWCPLFEVRNERIDKTERFMDTVHLHCGAGTRVIEIEEAKG